MKKSWYTIKAQATDSVAEISVLTDIGMKIAQLLFHLAQLQSVAK